MVNAMWCMESDMMSDVVWARVHHQSRYCTQLNLAQHVMALGRIGEIEGVVLDRGGCSGLLKICRHSLN